MEVLAYIELGTPGPAHTQKASQGFGSKRAGITLRSLIRDYAAAKKVSNTFLYFSWSTCSLARMQQSVASSTVQAGLGLRLNHCSHIKHKWLAEPLLYVISTPEIIHRRL